MKKMNELRHTSFSPVTVPWKTTRFVESDGFTLRAVQTTGMDKRPVWVLIGSSVNISSSTLLMNGRTSKRPGRRRLTYAKVVQNMPSKNMSQLSLICFKIVLLVASCRWVQEVFILIEFFFLFSSVTATLVECSVAD